MSRKHTMFAIKVHLYDGHVRNWTPELQETWQGTLDQFWEANKDSYTFGPIRDLGEELVDRHKAFLGGGAEPERTLITDWGIKYARAILAVTGKTADEVVARSPRPLLDRLDDAVVLQTDARTRENLCAEAKAAIVELKKGLREITDYYDRYRQEHTKTPSEAIGRARALLAKYQGEAS